MATPSGGGGDKSLLFIPQCAISEGQGAVHFPQAKKSNTFGKIIFYESLSNNLTYLAFFNQTKDRYVGKREMKVRT